MISNVTNTASATSGAAAGGSATNAAEMQDQFLTLLIAQLKNQDPTQPMDNAQMTSQMAQISTVSGIEKLNDTVASVTSQFTSMQMLQGANLIGRTVLADGNQLALSTEGQGTAAFDLGAAASDVKITVTTAGGQLIDQIDFGTAQAGRNYFTWDGSNYQGDTSALRFKVEAHNGAESVQTTALSPQAVMATSISNNALMLELANGQSLNYNNVKAVF